MCKSIVIIGAGGHGKVVADIVRKSGDFVRGFLDDNENLPEFFAGIPVLGQIKDYKKYLDSEFIVAIGNSEIRKRIVGKLTEVNWYIAIHPSAEIADIEVTIEKGTVIMANVVVNPGSRIGKHCIINSGAILEHDNYIGDYAHISVGAKLAGTVNIGKNVWIGVGATISNNLFICDNCVVGAGGVVIKNIEETGTYAGVPVRRLDVKKQSEKLTGGGTTQPIEYAALRMCAA